MLKRKVSKGYLYAMLKRKMQGQEDLPCLKLEFVCELELLDAPRFEKREPSVV